MKKQLLTLGLSLLAGSFSFAQTTATDFSVNDCNGNLRHLFAELDSGKVVVIAFVHPCGSCIGPSKSANNVVKSFASSHPGRVVFYIADDYGDNGCNTITNWASTNGMSGVITISDVNVKETQYGSAAMPKIVALSGWNKKVWFKQDNGLNTTNLTNAINNALTASSVADLNNISRISVYPNPLSADAVVEYELKESATVKMEIQDMIGKTAITLPEVTQEAGKHTLPFNASALANGVYFVRISTGNEVQTIKFTVTK